MTTNSKEYSKLYYENNKEHIRENHRKYYQKNRDKILKRLKEDRIKNLEKYLKRERDYYRKNKEKINFKKKYKLSEKDLKEFYIKPKECDFKGSCLKCPYPNDCKYN